MAEMKKLQGNGTFQFFLFHNIVPLITSAVVIALSWSSLRSEIQLLSQKVDFLVQAQKEFIDSRQDLETRFGEMALKVKELETIVRK